MTHGAIIAALLAVAWPAHAIKGGAAAEVGRWPYHVSMFHRDVHLNFHHPCLFATPVTGSDGNA